MKAGLRMWLSNVTIQVWPSGGALAAIAAPIAPAAPGLLSITMFQPVLSATLAARMRATGSVVPPGGKGTTTRIAPLGQSLGWARATKGAASDPPTTRRRVSLAMPHSPSNGRGAQLRNHLAAEVGVPLLQGRRRLRPVEVGREM